MSYDSTRGREDLVAFEAAQPTNFWRADPHVQRVVEHWAGEDNYRAWKRDLDEFGAQAAGPIDVAVRRNNLSHNLPREERWSSHGVQMEEIEHHPSFHLAGRSIYGTGMMTTLAKRGQNTKAMALFYLSSHLGEAGHNCPLACTAGLIKVLREVGSAQLQACFLPRLTQTDYPTLAHAGQFLTEVQGGSDVGANSVRAVPMEGEEGAWQLFGEKWFCSNVTADLSLVTARPQHSGEGTRGLGLFLMPRRLADGSLNHFQIRRLKDKIGTRTLPTAELDFDGAVAYQVGPLEDGFRNLMTHVINTSRIFNAMGCAGMAHRACLVAHGFASHRRAFDAPIREYPMVQETLADMRAETAAMVSGSFYLVHLLDGIERGEQDADAGRFWRIAINLGKMRSALSSHGVIQSALELLAGNGTIETFSVIPRLLRDNIVFENWEGSHNTLLMQVLRDCLRKEMHRPFFEHLVMQAAGHERLLEAVQATRAELEKTLAGEEALATIKMRGLGSTMSWLQWAVAMHQDGTDAQLLTHFIDRRIGPRAVRDRDYLQHIATLSKQA